MHARRVVGVVPPRFRSARGRAPGTLPAAPPPMRSRLAEQRPPPRTRRARPDARPTLLHALLDPVPAQPVPAPARRGRDVDDLARVLRRQPQAAHAAALGARRTVDPVLA